MYSVTRQIGIDAGHRIMTQGSKCRHPHGHRYTIEATCTAVGGRLQERGEQTGMVLDFGFLKDEMIRHIDAPCDHGFIIALADHELLEMFSPLDVEFDQWLEAVARNVSSIGSFSTTWARLGAKLYVVPFHPTAECLARHWFERLTSAVVCRSSELAVLQRVTVWETPNCRADYTL